MAPYGKVHDCLFGSSIMEEDLEIRWIWVCMIIIADKNGIVDETMMSLARRFNVPLKSIKKAISSFLKPDVNSRTIDSDGRRLKPIRKSFGWRIINYQYYRDLSTSQDRAEYMKEYMQEYRKPCKQKKLTEVNKGLPVNMDVNAVNSETHTDTDKRKYIKESKEIIEYLNTISGRAFKFTDSNIRIIKARLNEGHTIEDCKKVLDTKWADKEFDKKYFRPSTLFRPSKFEGYLNEKLKPERVWG